MMTASEAGDTGHVPARLVDSIWWLDFMPRKGELRCRRRNCRRQDGSGRAATADVSREGNRRKSMRITRK